MSESTVSTVTDNADRRQFEITAEDGEVAGFAAYRPGEGTREFHHTVVKDEYEGQGVGGRLTRGALDATRAEGLKVIATCPFVKGWIDKHPEYQDLLA